MCSAAVVESNQNPGQAPSVGLKSLQSFVDVATSKLGAPYKRSFASGILLAPYAFLGFSDAQRIRTFETNKDAVNGTPLSCKTKKQHGQCWPRACPREGITGSRECAQPLLDMRDAYRKINGSDPTFAFMRINH